MQLMRTLVLSLVSFAALGAADWKFQKSIVFSRESAPGLLRPYFAPDAKGGWMVLVTEMPEDAKRADAYEITVRYRDRVGVTWSRTQTARPGGGVVGDLFAVGDGTEVLSIAARAVSFESKKEVNQ